MQIHKIPTERNLVESLAQTKNSLNLQEESKTYVNVGSGLSSKAVFPNLRQEIFSSQKLIESPDSRSQRSFPLLFASNPLLPPPETQGYTIAIKKGMLSPSVSNAATYAHFSKQFRCQNQKSSELDKKVKKIIATEKLSLDEEIFL
jgi:hypothetical protein